MWIIPPSVFIQDYIAFSEQNLVSVYAGGHAQACMRAHLYGPLKGYDPLKTAWEILGAKQCYLVSQWNIWLWIHLLIIVLALPSQTL